jgi:pSer/pThr/pTyr-binding forkhead associated (FHA) protein
MDDGASRLHARFERHDAGFRMLDLDSGNGTFINGRRIQYAELYDGDLIAIGRTRIRFESVGWSRLPEERPSFVQTVLTQTFKNVPRTSMWPALVVAFCVGLVVVATMNIAGTTTGPSNAEMITQRVEQAEIHMANARWNDAKQEIVFARLLDTKSEKLKKLQLTLEQRTIDEDTHRLMGDYLRDGREVSTIEKLKKTISEQSPVASKAEALLLKARQVQAERYYVRAKRHFMAGRLQEAQSSAKKAVASDGRHKMSQNLLKSVMSEIQKR